MFKFLALALVAMSLGCNRHDSQTLIPGTRAVNILAVRPDPTHLVGPVMAAPLPGPLTVGVISGNHQIATVGSYCTQRLTVLVLDGIGIPVPGAQVIWVPEHPTDCYGLGTSSTDLFGVASARVGPAVPGVLYVRAVASTTYLVSNGVSFELTGTR